MERHGRCVSLCFYSFFSSSSTRNIRCSSTSESSIFSFVQVETALYAVLWVFAAAAAAAASPEPCGSSDCSLTGTTTSAVAASAAGAACGWAGHCLSDTCQTLNDCNGSSSGGGVPDPPSPVGDANMLN